MHRALHQPAKVHSYFAARMQSRKKERGRNLILVPPPAGKRLQKKVFESKCHTSLIIGGHWLAITD